MSDARNKAIMIADEEIIKLIMTGGYPSKAHKILEELYDFALREAADMIQKEMFKDQSIKDVDFVLHSVIERLREGGD